MSRTSVIGSHSGLDEEQVALRQLARDFAASHLRPNARAAADGDDELVMRLLREAAVLGLVSYSVPVEFGGSGVDPLTAALIQEELAFGDLGLATLLGSAQLFVGGVLSSGEATLQQLDAWVRPLARDEGAFAAIAFSEPHAGSDLANLRTRAIRDGDEWVISGEKTWITAGDVAELILVYARTSDDGPAGISAFVVSADQPGVTTQRLELTGVRSSRTASIFFDDVRVPATALLGTAGEGFGYAMSFFQQSRPQVAAAAVGLARAAFEYAAAYARERTAFGKPIINNQGISFMLADMGMQIEAARALVWQACTTIARGGDAGLVGSYAKAFASDVAMKVTTDAVQILGGAGLSLDHPVERFMRDAKVLQIVEGTNEIQRLICSRYYSSGIVATG